MLYDNQDVLQYLDKEKGKLVHLYGEPDAGRTQVLFSVINALANQDRFCCYWVPRKEEYRKEVFDATVGKKQCCIIGFPETAQELQQFLVLAKDTDLICVDNFLEYILHKRKAQIRLIFSLFSASAYEYGTNVLLVNDMRYLPEKGGLHPAYQEYFRYFCDRHIQVEKDSDFNIRYEFCKL